MAKEKPSLTIEQQVELNYPSNTNPIVDTGNE
jgi:hypothetical protein